MRCLSVLLVLLGPLSTPDLRTDGTMDEIEAFLERRPLRGLDAPRSEREFQCSRSGGIGKIIAGTSTFPPLAKQSLKKPDRPVPAALPVAGLPATRGEEMP
jgi:hypothetical protein